jgi:hypothetical protein
MSMSESESSKSLFGVSYEALKDAYTHSRHNTEVNRIIEEALNRIHNMPSEQTDRARVAVLEAEVSTLREHLAEVNRLMSLNCREVERLQRVNGALLLDIEDLKGDLEEARDELEKRPALGKSGEQS